MSEKTVKEGNISLMYKKAMSALVLMNLVFVFGFLSLMGFEEHKAYTNPAYAMKADSSLFADEKSSSMGIAFVAASGQRVVDFGVVERQQKYFLSEQDLEVLLRIVEAEAGGEDAEGKLLVANVVLNRVNSEKFPNTVSEVVFQREKGVSQFSPVSSGKIFRVNVADETKEAVGRALKGEDISQGALYFAARKYADSEKMRWFDEKLQFLFRHGGHEFFK